MVLVRVLLCLVIYLEEDLLSNVSGFSTYVMVNLQVTLRRNGTCCFLVTLSCCEPVKCDSLHDANDLLVRWSV